MRDGGWGGAARDSDSSGDRFVARFAGLAVEKDKGFFFFFTTPSLPQHVFFKRAHSPDVYRSFLVLFNFSHLIGNSFSLLLKIKLVQECVFLPGVQNFGPSGPGTDEPLPRFWEL